MKKSEERKEQMYKDRIENVDGGTFIPLIFTTKGARSYKTSKTITKLGSMIAIKKKERMCETIKKSSDQKKAPKRGLT